MWLRFVRMIWTEFDYCHVRCGETMLRLEHVLQQITSRQLQFLIIVIAEAVLDSRSC